MDHFSMPASSPRRRRCDGSVVGGADAGDGRGSGEDHSGRFGVDQADGRDGERDLATAATVISVATAATAVCFAAVVVIGVVVIGGDVEDLVGLRVVGADQVTDVQLVGGYLGDRHGQSVRRVGEEPGEPITGADDTSRPQVSTAGTGSC
jgi:hypothetical protein